MTHLERFRSTLDYAKGLPQNNIYFLTGWTLGEIV